VLLDDVSFKIYVIWYALFTSIQIHTHIHTYIKYKNHVLLLKSSQNVLINIWLQPLLVRMGSIRRSNETSNTEF
jgi:hypothetical protein